MRKRPVVVLSGAALLTLAGCANPPPQANVKNCQLDYEAMQAKGMVEMASLPSDSCQTNPEAVRHTLGFLEVARRMAAGVPVLGNN